ncbi:hypothetical protein B296_00007012 [Ensete ventricosum]|uniref:Uncharacterized protein n=1 Tax=Ensete ventricosum TaxID=4639 RepID=A0A426ZND1_ENSVE|nr:hypothetical protein B296_00007012 [Ensete ventricosum]
MHCVVGRLGLFLYGFIFRFEAFFRWFTVLILYWFNHEKSALFLSSTGVRQKKTKTRRKIIGGSRKACRERCSGISLEFARRFAKGIGKLVENTPGDRRKKTRRLIVRMSEAAGLMGGLVFTHRRSVVDVGMPQERGLGS